MRKFAILAVLSLCSAAKAQAPETRPYFYFTDKPGEILVSGATPGTSVTVVGHADWFETPQEVAEEVKQTLQAQINSGVTDESHVCITIMMFGNDWNHFLGVAPDFLDPADAITSTVAWEGGNTPDDELRRRCQQPWMTNGIEACTAWMGAFLARYNQLEFVHPPGTASRPLPVPARFHFDSEFIITPNFGEVNSTRILQALPLDSRWGSLDVPGTGQTMAELFGAAKTLYNWPSTWTSLENALDPLSSPSSEANQSCYLWVRSVTNRASDAAMKTAAYDVIHANHTLLGASWENVKVSNWGYANSDGAVNTFGWHPDAIEFVNNQHVRPPTTQNVRGGNCGGWPGAAHIWWHENGQSRLWLTEPGVNSADMEAPYCYRADPDHTSQYPPYAPWRDFYRNHIATSTWPEAEIFDTSMYNNRRWIESIINSNGGNVSNLAVWLPVKGMDAQGWAQRYDLKESRMHLAMLRAKKVPEIIFWFWQGDPGSSSTYTEFTQQAREVYDPQLDDRTVATGAEVQTGTSVPLLDRLRYTLRGPSDSSNPPRHDECMLVQSELINSVQTVEVQFYFNGLATGPQPIMTFALNLEAGVTALDVRGSVWQWNGQAWVQLVINDFPSGQGKFGFFAPVANGWYDTRRTFDQIDRLTNGDKLILKVVLQRTAETSTAFNASFDLVQVVGTPLEGGTDPGDTQGADYDYSGQVTTSDVFAFLQGFAASSPAADFNVDNAVNALDLSAFLNAIP